MSSARFHRNKSNHSGYISIERGYTVTLKSSSFEDSVYDHDFDHGADYTTSDSSTAKKRATWRKVILGVAISSLLFACGILGGLLTVNHAKNSDNSTTGTRNYTPSGSNDGNGGVNIGTASTSAPSFFHNNGNLIGAPGFENGGIESVSTEDEGSITEALFDPSFEEETETETETYKPSALGPSDSPTKAPSAPTKPPTLRPTKQPTSRPSDSPTTITADVTRVPIIPQLLSARAEDEDEDEDDAGNLDFKYKYDYRANSKDFLVGVYYYPWHGDNFHNREGYVRKDLVPQQYPLLGEYNDSDPKIITEHMNMFRKGNIGLLVTSWWGPGRIHDLNTKNVIMKHEDVGNLKIALHYETFGRLGREVDRIENAKSDLEYMCEQYFDHPNYYKIDGRPVLFLYLSRNLHRKGHLEEALLTMRSTANKCGHNLYIVGDHSFGKSTSTSEDDPHLPFWYMDAITNYDVYGASGRPAGYVGREGVVKHYEYQSDWKKEASKENCRFIPSVSPGYNDRGVRLNNDHPALSRRITADDEEGSLFYFQLKQAKGLVDGKVDNLIMVNSFNEWHEDTQIEPVAIGESASWPPLMTEGLEYVGYGDLYLNILGASTVSKDHQGIFDHLYNN
eukprot:jgi/Psemu1/63780/estExt_Genemark1.C_370012